MDTWTIISTIFATLFGGLNIYQLLTFRAYKKKANAEADRTEIDNLRTIISGMQSEIGRLQTRLDEAEKRAYENSNRYYALQQEFETYKLNHK